MPRKVHNREDGYVAERRNPLDKKFKVVIYDRKKGYSMPPCGSDSRYVVICKTHGLWCLTTSLPKARNAMKDPKTFCDACEKWHKKMSPMKTYLITTQVKRAHGYQQWKLAASSPEQALADFNDPDKPREFYDEELEVISLDEIDLSDVEELDCGKEEDS